MIFEKRFTVTKPRSWSNKPEICQLSYTYDPIENEHSLTIWGSHNDADVVVSTSSSKTILNNLDEYSDITVCDKCHHPLDKEINDLSGLREWLFLAPTYNETSPTPLGHN